MAVRALCLLLPLLSMYLIRRNPMRNELNWVKIQLAAALFEDICVFAVDRPPWCVRSIGVLAGNETLSPI